MDSGRIEISLMAVLLIILLITGAIVGALRFFDRDKEEPEIELASVGIAERTPSVLMEVPIEDELIQLLYSYLVEYVEFYKSEKSTADTLSNRDKILAVCISLDHVDRLTISLEDFNTRLKLLFGNNVTVEHETTMINNILGGYTFAEDHYVINTGGRGGFGSFELTKLIKAEQIDDYIYLYDRYVMFWADGPDEALYADVEGNIVIIEGTSREPIWDPTYGLNIDYFITIYGTEIPTYKHIFKRGESGHYHWVSTEISSRTVREVSENIEDDE